MSGYCAIGITRRETSPAIVVTSAITIASRGRSTKMAENIDLALIQIWHSRVCLDRHTGPQRLNAVDNDLLAARQTFGDNYPLAICSARFDPTDHDLAVLDNKDVDALLIGNQSGLWHDDLFLRCPGLESDRYQLTVDQLLRGIGENGPDLHRIGRLVHGDIDEVDLPYGLVTRSVGKAQHHLYAGDVRRVRVLPRLHQRALAHWEQNVHRVLADDRRQRAALRGDDIALRDHCAADLAGDRRDDIGIAEIDLRRFQVGLVDQDLGGGGAVGGQRLVARDDGAAAGLHQLLGPLELNCRQQFLRLARLQRALRLVDRGLELVRFDPVERLSLLYKVAFREQHLFEEAGDAGLNIDPLDRLNPTDEIGGPR